MNCETCTDALDDTSALALIEHNCDGAACGCKCRLAQLIDAAQRALILLRRLESETAHLPGGSELPIGRYAGYHAGTLGAAVYAFTREKELARLA